MGNDDGHNAANHADVAICALNESAEKMVCRFGVVRGEPGAEMEERNSALDKDGGSSAFHSVVAAAWRECLYAVENATLHFKQ